MRTNERLVLLLHQALAAQFGIVVWTSNRHSLEGAITRAKNEFPDPRWAELLISPSPFDEQHLFIMKRRVKLNETEGPLPFAEGDA